MKTHLMRALALIGIFGAASSIAPLAEATPLSLSDLPAAPVSSAASAGRTLSEIPANEKVDGILVTSESRGNPSSYSVRTVTVRSPASSGHPPSTCFSSGGTGSAATSLEIFNQVTYATPTPTPSGQRPPARPAVSARPTWVSEPPRKGEVTIVHTERLIERQGGVVLELSDVLVDPNTFGARLVNRTSTPLGRVAKGPNNLEIFALREPTPNTVQFVVRAPLAQADESDSMASVRRRLLAQVPDARRSGVASSDCGHLRFTLRAKRGDGEMATVMATVVLPTVAHGEPAIDEEGDDDDDREELRRRRQAHERSLRSTRTRPVLVNLSISQTTTEKAPLVSVSFAWGGKDQDLRF
jgi:hypothetical protein